MAPAGSGDRTPPLSGDQTMISPPPLSGDATIVPDAGGQTWATPAAQGAAPQELAGHGPAPQGLEPGSVLANRYEIIALLGDGGMGAVYKATDRELDRVVALKVIRPELAGQPQILQRFKQELILARKITHKNVIRIFDLGSAGPLKFITMEYIDGRSLAGMMEAGRFTVEDAVKMIRQVCLALEAAHTEGVTHRDLKPQNIMVNQDGTACVMDFGLARSAEMHGMTQTGAFMGTPAYMSPEQARGETADTRSDLFALGIIFYELLTGKAPYQSETVLGSLLKRTQETPRAPVEIDPAVPKELSNIVLKCLAIQLDDRYQTAGEILQDLDAWAQGRPGLATMYMPRSLVNVPAPKPPVRPPYRKWAVGAAALLVLAAVGFLVRDRLGSGSVGPHKPVVVLVADFRNTTGDPLFDGTLESVFNVAMEGASFVSAYNRSQARRIATTLQPNVTTLDEPLARLVALREGISVIIGGSILRAAEAYRVTARATDAVTGKLIASRESDARNKEAVLAMIGPLAAPLRKALGDTTPEAVQLQAAETFTASSLEAVHAHAVGLEYLAAGKKEDAIREFSRAVEIDPNFGRGYIGLAVAYTNLKKQAEAGENYKKSLALLDRVSEREKYRTLGVYYASYARNYEQAIETLRKLVYLYPADAAGYNNLSLAYAFTRNIPEALNASRKALEITPKNLQRRANFAGYSMLAGDFETACSGAESILKENPQFEYAYLPLALSKLARGDVAAAREVYSRLEKASPRGYSVAKTGEADLEMYLGRYKPAIEALQAGIAADQKDKNTGEMALKFVAQAEAQLALGQRAQAVEGAAKAAQLSPAESVLFLAGRVLAQAGEEAKAKVLAASLESMLQAHTKADARLIAGEVALQRHRVAEAVEAFQEALRLHNSWMAHFLLGQAYVEAGHFAEALTELETCRQRRGEAADLFIADMTTLRYLPPLYYWIGRAQEGLGTTQAARASYQEFLKLRTDGDPGGPLVADTKRRAGRQ